MCNYNTLVFFLYESLILTVSAGVSVETLFVPSNITTFSSDGAINRFMVPQSTVSIWSPSMLEVNKFDGLKYLCHTFKYLEKPAIIESPSNKVFLERYFKRR